MHTHTHTHRLNGGLGGLTEKKETNSDPTATQQTDAISYSKRASRREKKSFEWILEEDQGFLCFVCCSISWSSVELCSLSFIALQENHFFSPELDRLLVAWLKFF